MPSNAQNIRPTRDKSGDVIPARQTKKGKQRYFGVNAHISLDAESNLVHAVVAVTNINDVSETHQLLLGVGAAAKAR